MQGHEHWITGRVVILNGCSSSGKTTLARNLQARLPGVWVVFGLDTLMEGLWTPPDPSENDVAMLATAAARLETAWCSFVDDISSNGVNVLLDWVAQDGRRGYDRWSATLRDRLTWVNVVATLEVLEERERARADRQDGLARFHFTRVHSNVPADVTVDTGALPPDEAAMAVHAQLGLRVRDSDSH